MQKHRFYQIDVFTDKPLAGNPLAVFPEADGLDDDTMQAIAREMSLSETTFVMGSDRATKKVKIFTPASEVPLAGHPTIGTWWLLAELGLVDLPTDDNATVTQETGAGILPVDIAMRNGKPARVTMTQTQPQFLETIHDPEELAAAIGADVADLVEDLHPQVVSTALPQMMIPLRSLEALTSLPTGGEGPHLAEYLTRHGSDCAMCFKLEELPTADGTTTYRAECRMFAPGLGVPEDPGTGSAAGALGAYLAHHGRIKAHEGVAVLNVDQGAEIGRPCAIRVEIAIDGGKITSVRVSGEAVTVVTGELYF